MLEVTYRVALMCYMRQPNGDLRQRCVHISRRAYLACKPSIGETVIAPFLEQGKMTRFVVARVEHCTHLCPPSALSYVPEYLGEITLLAPVSSHDNDSKILFLDEEHSGEEWKSLFANATKIGWTVDASVDIAHLAP